MKNVNLAIRKALVAALSAVPYKGVNIPVFEEYVQETPNKKIAVIQSGTMPVQCYAIIQNQVSNENTNSKCNRRDEATLQININTVFPDNKGGSLTAEEISEVILSILYTNDNFKTSLVLPEPFYVQTSEVITVRNLQYENDTNRIWTTVLVLNFTVSQSYVTA